MVDDHSQSLAFLVQLLEKLGFHTLQATDGKQALAEARLNRPDVILIDLLLPVIDGYEVIHQIRTSNDKHIPIIALTANANIQNMHKAYQCGANSFLIKPCKLSDIITALEDIPAIDFIYHTETTTQAVVQRPAINTGALSVVPEQLRLKLRRATETGDIQQLRSCLDTIEQNDHDLALVLTQLVERYDYDTLLEILN